MTITPEPLAETPLLRFWRGGYPLWVSWLVGVALNVGSALVIRALAFAVGERAFDPYTIAGALAAMWGVAAAILLYQSVGVWRAAARHAARSGAPPASTPTRTKMRRLFALAAQLTVLASVANFVSLVASSGVRQMEETWRMAFEGDPDIPDFTIRTMRDGTEMEIAGGFKYGLTQEAREIMDATPKLEVVHLASAGGRIGEATQLARLIQERELSTYVATSCLSACTIAFIAGHERFLKAGGKLGFHRAAFAGIESSGAMSGLLLAAGIERSFTDRVAAQPATGMWYPTAAELKAAHVITATVDTRRFASSGLGAQPGALAFARDLRGVGLYRAFEAVEPRLFLRLVERYERGYETGQSEGEIQDRLGEVTAPVIRRHVAAADNGVLIDYANLMADQFAAVGAKDARACFLRITRGATPDQSVLLDADLRDREQAIQARALRATAPRTPVPRDLLQADYATVFRQLGDRYSAAELQMFDHPGKVTPAQYPVFCRMTTAMFRAIAALPPTRAGDVMSTLFRSMDPPPPK